MKTALSAALITAVLAYQPAHAAIQTYQFSGTVDRLYELGVDINYVSQASAWSGGTIRTGQAFSGSFSFDDQLVMGGYPNGSFSISFGPDISYSSTSFNIGVYSWQPGTYAFSAFGGSSTGFGFNAEHSLTPGQPYTLTAQTGAVSGTWSGPTGQYYGFGADVDSIVNVTPVPEPSTYAMLVAGLALVGAHARRVRASRRS